MLCYETLVSLKSHGKCCSFSFCCQLTCLWFDPSCTYTLGCDSNVLVFSTPGSGALWKLGSCVLSCVRSGHRNLA